MYLGVGVYVNVCIINVDMWEGGMLYVWVCLYINEFNITDITISTVSSLILMFSS